MLEASAGSPVAVARISETMDDGSAVTGTTGKLVGRLPRPAVRLD